MGTAERRAGCRGCAWGAGDTRGDPWFLFNSFISELEAGARGMVMNGADGAPPGGVGNNGSVCDAERLERHGGVTLSSPANGPARRWPRAKLATRRQRRPGEEGARQVGRQLSRCTRCKTLLLPPRAQGEAVCVPVTLLRWPHRVSEFQQNPENQGAERAAGAAPGEKWLCAGTHCAPQCERVCHSLLVGGEGTMNIEVPP